MISIQFEQMLQFQESIAEQSLSLLKEQAIKIKMQSRDLELKDEQVQFLKETILALEQEKDSLAHQNHQLKSKLKTMAAQISHYNATVVQKIYQENQDLGQKIAELTQQTQSLTLERATLIKKISECEEQLVHQSNSKKQAGQNLQKLKEIAGKNEKKLELMERQNKELQHKNISLQRQLEERSSQISYCSQQIDILTQKHHDALKNSEKKLKSTIEKMAPKQDLQQLEKELKQMAQRNKQLKLDLDRILKQKDQLKFQIIQQKEKLLNIEIKEETQYLQLKTDLVNLLQSLKIGKKITEFQSKEQEKVQAIYDCYISVLRENEKITRALELNQDRNQKASSQRDILSQKLKNAEIDFQTFKECSENQKEAIEADYQSKLMEISIRLKRQQIALTQLRNKESALESLQEQFEKQVQDRQAERQTLNRTIQQLQKESMQINSQLNQALQLCEQNMLSRQCITHYKYTLQEIVAVVHYLYQLLLQKKERNQALFSPFISHYFLIKSVINSHQREKHPLRKARASVWAVVALIRMRKQLNSSGRGLERHSYCAVERRYKIENLGWQIEKLSNFIIKGNKASTILKESQELYRWKPVEYVQIRMTNRDSELIEKMINC